MAGEALRLEGWALILGASSGFGAAIVREAHVRRLVVELGPRQVTVNALRAGVTDTPALRKIPGHEELLANAARLSPGGRLTRTEDIARAVAAMALSETSWISGNVIGVDAGENLTS